MLIAEEAALRDIIFENCNLKSAIFTHSSLRNVQYHNCDRNDMSLEKCYKHPEAEIVKINPEDLRNMSDKEGLILQGCGGDSLVIELKKREESEQKGRGNNGNNHN